MGSGQTSGFVILWRKVMDSWLWRLSGNDFKLACACILCANWKDSEWYDGSQIRTIKRGQFVTSRNKLAESCWTTPKKVRCGLARLTKAEFLILGTALGQAFTLVTVCNYDEYQALPSNEGQALGQARAKQGPSKGQARATGEQGNKETRKPESTPTPANLPGYGGLKPSDRAVLDAHLEGALRLWHRQDEIRAVSIPGARPITPTADRLLRVACCLAGNSMADCEHALLVRADECRRDPSVRKWFNGETNWRAKSFGIALGQPAPAPVNNRNQVDELPPGVK